MSAAFAFDHRLEFRAGNAGDLLRGIPASPGIFALRGEDPSAEPYLTQAADLRRRLRRLLAPPEMLDETGQPVASRRLNLRDRVRWIEWTRTGSAFESTLLLYQASRAAFGPEHARKRLRLPAPVFLRITLSHRIPRIYSTNRLSRRAPGEFFGPFPSRAACERYADAILDLYHLRRCYEDLQPFPDHPGCVFGEMNRCMQPCKYGNPQACTPEQYAAEAQRVLEFLNTRGQSLLDETAQQREAASEGMEFEAAAALHKQWEKVRAAALLTDELVRPVNQLRAVIVQIAAPRDAGPHSSTWVPGDPIPEGDAEVPSQEAAIFLLDQGALTGPERLSTLGVRAVREQTAVGSSLFAQPLMLAAVPLADPAAMPEPAASTQTPEDRARGVLDRLEQRALAGSLGPDELGDTLSLFRRWYYRPEKQRAGEVFLPNPDGSWPIRRILNGAARVVLGPPTAASPVDREAARALAPELKTRVLHPGREGVERVVPVLPRRKRKTPLPSVQG